MIRIFRLSFILMLVLAFSAVSVASAQDETVIFTSPNGDFSVRLPADWVAQEIDNVPDYSDAFAFASSQQDLQDAINLLVFGSIPNQLPHMSGMIGVLDPGQIGTQGVNLMVTPVLQFLVGQLQTQGVQVLGTAQSVTFGGLYPGQVVDTTFGSVAVMHSEDRLLIALILTEDTAADLDAIDAILNSIRIPPESTAPATPEPVPSEEVAPVTPEPAPSEEVAPAAPLTVRSSDMRTSLVIPEDWTLLDNIADQNILAYGDSVAAAQSRLYAAKPDLAPDTAITGDGGLVILYAMSQFGIDPAAPDFAPLMERALAGLTGYTVEQAPAPLGSGGLVAVISGAETGYLALIPFGDQFAYVTATSATGDQFEQDEAALLAILESVRIPAEPEATPTPAPSGLGGLGGLAESTPEPTPSGLGGLGGLSAVTPEATAES